MSETLNQAAWRVGSNSNEFADIGGFRYCVDYPRRDSGEAFRVLRDGIEIAGPTCIGSPAGFKNAGAARHYAEWHADMNRAA